MNSIAREIVGDFISLFYPNHCLACEDTLVKGEDIICSRCMLEMPKTEYHELRENPLFNRLSYRFPLAFATAQYRFRKSGRVQHLLHELKYKNHPEIGEVLGRVYGQQLSRSAVCQGIQVIVPVPLHPSRMRRRGYNQSASFAAGLSESLGIPYREDYLARKSMTATQTTKTKLSRWENMRGVFQVPQSAEIADKRIMLVDDVITTGSTLEACAEVLLASGCRELGIVCIAEA